PPAASLFHTLRKYPLLTLGMVATFVFIYALQFVVGKALIGQAAVTAFRFREWLRDLFIKFGVCVLGTGASWFHLRYFDRWFLERGEWDMTGHDAWEKSYKEATDRIDEMNDGDWAKKLARVSEGIAEVRRVIVAKSRHDGDGFRSEDEKKVLEGGQQELEGKKGRLEGEKRALIAEVERLAVTGRSPSQSFRAHRTAGRELMALQKYEEALSHYRQAHMLDATDIESYRRMGILTNRLDNRAEALKIVNAVIEADPNDAESWGLLGRWRKEAWIASWRNGDVPSARQRAAAAASLGLLREVIKAYLQGFTANTSNAYVGGNAITFLHLLFHLDPATDIEPAAVLALTREVQESIDRGLTKVTRDYWALVTFADFVLLRGDTAMVRRAYEEAADFALNTSDRFGLDSSRQQLELLRELGFRAPEVGVALDVFEAAMKRIDQEDAAAPAGSVAAQAVETPV
ncbi:MAG TPA: tetratricopeptide repeat protein, partial [Pyrinomonadaceae bacterium]|nr:tetratricopeptide repeat protein [Pyrinomonadaceae bacterium]